MGGTRLTSDILGEERENDHIFVLSLKMSCYYLLFLHSSLEHTMRELPILLVSWFSVLHPRANPAEGERWESQQRPRSHPFLGGEAPSCPAALLGAAASLGCWHLQEPQAHHEPGFASPLLRLEHHGLEGQSPASESNLEKMKNQASKNS